MGLRTADITLPVVDAGEVRPVVGDAATGVGFAASVPFWTCGPAFVSCPNPATSGASCQALLWQEGNVTRVIAARDNRFVDKAGALALGDAAIVTDSEAWFKLTKAGDKVELRTKSGSDEMKVALDGGAGTIVLSVGGVSLTVDATGINVVGAFKVNGIPAVVNGANPSALVMSAAAGVTISSGTASINLAPTGAAAITGGPTGMLTDASGVAIAKIGPPATLSVNGVPLIVP